MNEIPARAAKWASAIFKQSFPRFIRPCLIACASVPTARLAVSNLCELLYNLSSSQIVDVYSRAFVPPTSTVPARPKLFDRLVSSVETCRNCTICIRSRPEQHCNVQSDALLCIAARLVRSRRGRRRLRFLGSLVCTLYAAYTHLCESASVRLPASEVVALCAFVNVSRGKRQKCSHAQ